MSAPRPQATIAALVDEYGRSHPADLARKLERMRAEDLVEFFAERGAKAASVFDRLGPPAAADVVTRIDAACLRELLPAADPTFAASVIARLDEESRARILDASPAALRAELERLLSYPPDTAGSLMDPRVIVVRPETTAAEALSLLQEAKGLSRQEVFEIDDEGKLTGSVRIIDLAVAEAGTPVRTMVDREPPRLTALSTREEIVGEFERSKRPVLPVVDFHGKLIGVLRQAAIVGAALEESSVNVQTMVGASRDETALSKVSFAVRKRLPWLQINLLTAFLAASVVGLFEETIATFTALAVLLPVVAGQSGNTGQQALAVTMRGLALREVRPRHWARISWKELNVALLNGVAVAATTALGVYFWSGSAGLTMVIAASMVISMGVAGLAGAAIPMVLSAIGQDPAQSSSIILTTVTDVVGFFSFLGIASMLSSML
jgi:magnesium transporter